MWLKINIVGRPSLSRILKNIEIIKEIRGMPVCEYKYSILYYAKCSSPTLVTSSICDAGQLELYVEMAALSKYHKQLVAAGVGRVCLSEEYFLYSTNLNELLQW